MNATLRTGIVRDAGYLEHHTENGHPENHRRLAAIYDMLDAPDMQKRFVTIAPRLARRDEILMLHSPEHLKKIASTAGHAYTALTPDTHASAGSYRAARLAAGGLFEAVAAVVSGNLQNAFALVRPPGHHAERSRALGYCLFNNVALGAAYARESLGLPKVLIVDWDVHHGNGTQHMFEKDNSVLFFSIHQYPHFPGTGFYTEAGSGRGEGFTVNIPIPRGYGDGEYVAIFEKVLRPLALEFGPSLILVSAGFDMHVSDPLGGMKLTDGGFAGLTRSLMNMADDCCNGKLVLALEGGYNAETIGGCVKAVLNELSDTTHCRPEAMAASANRKKLAYALRRSVNVQRHYWKCYARLTDL
jgi:acetoin utilization deacetylase AcuC-like enzyme